MINAEQIRSARALLDWSTAVLAKRTGLTVNGINKIERSHVMAQRDTLEKLQNVFEEAGIEFLPGSGLRKKDHIIEVYKGESAPQRLVEDIYNTLCNFGGEILVAHIDEGDAIRGLGVEFLSEQIRKRKKAKIYHRFLVRANDTNLIPPLSTYHILPDEYFSSCPVYVYETKTALTCWQAPKKVVIIDDELFSKSVKKLFDFVWDHTESVPSYRKTGEFKNKAPKKAVGKH